MKYISKTTGSLGTKIDRSGAFADINSCCERKKIHTETNHFFGFPNW
jgi:hypothetical protein